MRSRPFASADPFLKLLLLFLLSFMCLGVFMLMAQGITSLVWGVSFFTDPESINAVEGLNKVYVNWTLLFFQHLGLFVVPALLFASLAHHDTREVLGIRRVPVKILLLAPPIMLLCIPAVNAMAWLNELMRLPAALAPLEEALQRMEEQAAELTQTLTGVPDLRFLMVNLVVMAAIPAIGEEMIFRGLIQRILHSWSGKVHVAVWTQAILFSAIHLQFYGFLPRLVLGALLGYLFVWSKSLWVPIIAHFTNNAVALLLMYLIATGALSEELDAFRPETMYWVALAGTVPIAVGLAWYIKRSSVRSFN